MLKQLVVTAIVVLASFLIKNLPKYMQVVAVDVRLLSAGLLSQRLYIWQSKRAVGRIAKNWESIPREV